MQLSRRSLLQTLPTLMAPFCRRNTGGFGRRLARDLHLGAFAPGDLPLSAARIVRNLMQNQLRIVRSDPINAVVRRLSLANGNVAFRAKWKPLGWQANELQEGFDGNNSPRCELAAFQFNQLLFGLESTEDYLVAPVVLRAFHRPIPCNRACASVPILPPEPDDDYVPTFPTINDHLVFGALTYWIDGTVEPSEFSGPSGLWSIERWQHNVQYRRSFANLCAFLFLIAHGDANYSSNFLLRQNDLARVYSIDNGRAFDGVSFYTDEADPSWAPFAHLAPEQLVAPGMTASMRRVLSGISLGVLQQSLRVNAVGDLSTGRVHTAGSSLVTQYAATPMRERADVQQLSRGSFLVRSGPQPRLVLSMSEAGISATMSRIQQLLAAPIALI